MSASSRQKKGGDIWLVGGADIFTELLKADLIDKLTITIAPVLLGDGISLVSTNLKDVPLKLETTIQHDQVVTLTYQVCKKPLE
ncbi:dihydrofolate reductase family protein [Lacticaseibacillus camelliae]|uniref:dihydrofolate reductase family protein n=1 Tax=Lacticaseibacillus camelliae TaxID=381742 RepID=UPI000A3DE892|nr:dihydrofolate reductase family protein [Lacticaseibacillus camelliae]